MATRGLTLTRLGVTEINYRWAGAHRIRVEASDPRGGMDPNVFLWRRDPYDPTTGETLDVALTVCSPVDLADYPAGAPDASTPYPFFRRDYFEVDVRATRLADDLWAAVQVAVGVLCEALDRLEALTPVAAAECGAPPEAQAGSDSASALP